MPISNWEKTIEERLPLFGHRNWVVVADAAYPAQSRHGIETITSGASQQEAVEKVLKLVCDCRHIRPIIYVDRELDFIDEKDAPGADSYRRWLKAALAEHGISTMPHDDIIAKLDQAAQMFSVLILKTTMTIPYTTVFFELDCGYWNAQSETQLRTAMKRLEAKR
jgi:hypothetical protein